MGGAVMRHLRIGISCKSVLLALTVFFVLPIYCGSSDAYVYDDFTGPSGSAVDATKWVTYGSGFTLSGDGYLNFNNTSSSNGKLVSTCLFDSGVFTMPFLDYSSNNDAPPAMGLGSVVALGLGYQSAYQWVRIERGQVHGSGYIEVNWQTNEGMKTAVNYVPSAIESGFLQLRYDGADVTFFYRTLETDPWSQMVITGQGGIPVPDMNGNAQPLVVMPGWTSDVPVFIQGIPGGPYNGEAYNLSFKADQVTVDVPEPATSLLLLSGLAAIFNRRAILTHFGG